MKSKVISGGILFTTAFALMAVYIFFGADKIKCFFDDADSCYRVLKNLENTSSPDDRKDEDFMDDINYYSYKTCSLGKIFTCTHYGMYNYYTAKDYFGYKRAYDLFKIACEYDDGDACYFLGLMHRSGRGAYVDLQKYLSLENRSCDLESDMGCNQIGEIYAEGFATDTNYPKAAELFAKSCENNYGRSCYNLGRMYEKGKYYFVDDQKAQFMYDKGCYLNYADSCYSLARQYLKNSDISDPEVKIKVSTPYIKACRLKNYQACVDLSLYILNRMSILERPMARRFLKQACFNKNGQGCYVLADLLEENLSRRSQSDEKGNDSIDSAKHEILNLYMKSCSYGFKDGCKKLSENYVVGAVDDYSACQLGVGKACLHMGRDILKNGSLGNFSEAVNFFVEGCNFSDAESCLTLSILYNKEKIYSNDPKNSALIYAIKACNLNSLRGCEDTVKYLSSYPEKAELHEKYKNILSSGILE